MRDLRRYIEKSLKATVVSTAAVAFLCSGLLCCCLSKSAHAQNEAPKLSRHCQAQQAEHANSQKSKTCDCCKIVKNGSLQADKIFELAQAISKDFKSMLALDSFLSLPKRIVSLRLAYQGPPRANTSLPIYLQFSSLRL